MIIQRTVTSTIPANVLAKKENMKNTVFALKSFKNVTNNFIQDGYLLFNNEKRADSFIEMCELFNKNGQPCHYEKYENIEVNDFVYNKVQTQANFYIKMLEHHQI